MISTRLSYKVNNTAVENMATGGARASAAMIFTWLSWNIPREAIFIIVSRTAITQSQLNYHTCRTYQSVELLKAQLLFCLWIYWCNEPAKCKRLGRSGTFMAQWFRRWTLERATLGSIPARSVTLITFYQEFMMEYHWSPDCCKCLEGYCNKTKISVQTES